ncbi:MAG: hypothetical protein AAF039_01580 [Bacteroidota bacterium]
MVQELIDFSKEHFNIIIYFIALTISIVNYRKYFDTVLKYFPALIAYTFFNELLGYFIRYSDKFAFFEDVTFANDIIYNIYDLFYYGFFLWVFWKLATSPKLKKVIGVLAFAVVLGYLISLFFQDPFLISLYYATSLASFVLAIVILLHWISRSHGFNWEWEKYNLLFWVSFGLFIFHLIFPFLFLTIYLNRGIAIKFEFHLIVRYIIVIMYLLFCIGFITSRRRAFR